MKWRADHSYCHTLASQLKWSPFTFFPITDLTMQLSFNGYSMYSWSCSSLHVSPPVSNIVLFVSLSCVSCQSACLYVCVCVCLVIMFCVCALFYVLVGDSFLSLQRTWVTLYHKTHTVWAYCAQIQLICLLDQLFTNRLQMHVWKLIIRGWHVAFSRIDLTPYYAMHSKHIFMDSICFWQWIAIKHTHRRTSHSTAHTRTV